MTTRFRRLSALLPLAILAPTLAAQCVTQWAPYWHFGDFDEPIDAVALFDPDGAGPAAEFIVVGGRFTYAGGESCPALAVWDGTRWTDLGAGLNIGVSVQAMAVFDPDAAGPEPASLYVTGNFSQIGGVPAQRLARWDGMQWYDVGGGLPNPPVGQQAYISDLEVWDADGAGPEPGVLVVAGSFQEIGSLTTRNVAGWTGSEWITLGAGLPSRYARAICSFDADGPGPGLNALIVSTYDYDGIASRAGVHEWTGLAWEQLGGDFNLPIYACTSIDTDGAGPSAPILIAAGAFAEIAGQPARHIARWDGSAWTELDGRLYGAVYAMEVVDPDGGGPVLPVLYVAGQFEPWGVQPLRFLSRWSAVGWEALPEETNGGVRTLAHSPALGLVVGGDFSRAGDLDADCVAVLDHNDWYAVGNPVADNGLGGRARGLALFDDDGAGPRAAALYVGGFFVRAGSLITGPLARWSDEGWSAPTPEPPGPVVNVLLPWRDAAGNEVLLAGGTSGLDVGGPQGWSRWPFEFNRDIFALTEFDADGAGPLSSRLIAGGDFTSIDGATFNHIAQWDGQEWLPLGGGLDGDVHAVFVWDSDGAGPQKPKLYVAGEFDYADALRVSRIAAWTGTDWQDLAVGVTGPSSSYGRVDALTSLDLDGAGPGEELLIAGGTFDEMGGVAARYVAAWDGRSWSALGAGPSFWVAALGAWDADDVGPEPAVLYAAGGSNSWTGGLARWSGGIWSPTDYAYHGAAALLPTPGDETTPPRLYVSGSFSTIEGVPSGRIAALEGCIPLRGDMNCSGAIDNEDIDPFVLAIVNRTAYEAAWPECSYMLADLTRDGLVDNEDIDPFVEALLHP